MAISVRKQKMFRVGFRPKLGFAGKFPEENTRLDQLATDISL